MTFTYDLTDPTDRERVRFYLQDTDSALEKFDDETIAFAISEEGSWQSACIVLVMALIQQLSSEPDFKADWLAVDHARALKGLQALLSELRMKFRISGLGLDTVRYVHRKAYE